MSRVETACANFPWPKITEKVVLPQDNVMIYRAQSILTEGGEVGPLLPPEQAVDVVSWYGKFDEDTK